MFPIVRNEVWKGSPEYQLDQPVVFRDNGQLAYVLEINIHKDSHSYSYNLGEVPAGRINPYQHRIWYNIPQEQIQALSEWLNE